MNRLSPDFELNKYGLHVRYVCENDAEFILGLRTDPILARFLHSTDNDLQKQKEWIREYKLREARGEDYYFIYSNENDYIGVNRLYNIKDNSATAGSWICKSDADGMASILTIIILRDILFDIVGAEYDYFDVRKGNKKVQRLHEMCGAVIESEDELNYYYRLSAKDYRNNKEQILQLIQN